MATKKNIKTTNDGIFVYLGPSVRGVIQNGSIFRGTREQVIKNLHAAIEKYPKIERLIVEDVDLAAAKEKLRKSGNSVSNAYRTFFN